MKATKSSSYVESEVAEIRGSLTVSIQNGPIQNAARLAHTNMAHSAMEESFSRSTPEWINRGDDVEERIVRLRALRDSPMHRTVVSMARVFSRIWMMACGGDSTIREDARR